VAEDSKRLMSDTDIILFIVFLVSIAIGVSNILMAFNTFKTEKRKPETSFDKTKYKKKCFERKESFRSVYCVGMKVNLSEISKSCIKKIDNFTAVNGGVYYNINASCVNEGTVAFHKKEKCSQKGYVKIER